MQTQCIQQHAQRTTLSYGTMYQDGSSKFPVYFYRGSWVFIQILYAVDKPWTYTITLQYCEEIVMCDPIERFPKIQCEYTQRGVGYLRMCHCLTYYGYRFDDEVARDAAELVRSEMLLQHRA